jgi:uracil-DNA glycosylase
MNVKIHPTWKQALAEEFNQPYFKQLADFVKDQYQSAAVYPPPAFIFRALDSCPFDQVKVVILGQDPYHGPGQANGLCFSVNPGVPFPPSLQNIYQELEQDLGHPIDQTGDLSHWANQGVLLLNATLTVRANVPGSHQNKGWERFTDKIIQILSDQKTHLVFLLWGSYAHKKGSVIDESKHLVLKSAHPSPLSAHRGFFGCRHFSQANVYLALGDIDPIDW